MEEKEIISKIKEELPRGAMITDYCFEGANVVLYSKNKTFLFDSKDVIKKIVDKLKKRVEIRPDTNILMNEEKAREVILSLIPKDANLADIWFDSKRSIVIIEAEKPGIVIGKNGNIMKQIFQRTLWVPRIRRSPSIKSNLVRTIREVLFKNSEYRRHFLNKIGKKIYSGWKRNSKYWIRLACLGGFREVGRSCLFLQTPKSKVLLDCGVNVASTEHAYPYLDVPEFEIEELDAVVISHSHLDHCGFLPYLYKLGYRGPVYCTEATRDVMTLLQLDYIDVSMSEAKKPIYSSKDINEMIKHSVTLKYDEVSDITSDIRITLHNAGHILGSSLIHLNIGDGFHNILYTSDFKFSRTKLLEAALCNFQRLETLIIESTYGGADDVQPTRKECDEFLINIVNDTIKKGGKILIPVLGGGRAQEVMLVLEEAIRHGKIKEIPIFVDGMVWDITAIHTTYPEMMNRSVRKLIFHRNYNPFLSSCFFRIGSQEERKKVIEEKGPCVILATSGMLVGGPSVFYLKELADNPNNALIFVSYQAEGSLGREIQKGVREIPMEIEGKTELLPVKLSIYTIEGYSGHSDREQLINFVKRLEPKPKRIIVNHGENSKCLDLASTLHKLFKIETNVPRNLDVLRIR
ncbi:MAG: beta-CASP ribonuclease aCPSF1 [Candidatus Parvarchaeota archaeon]|nr:beta-CASP ribonuclease aCPSF1 [Candidatus Jingweiarchaeum tengchongense]MCW1298406.1 beta-CASP ribonuclease aCPSF1 [Candidatus Jingweiarchaeum tengchongense]MCW1300292.1 beta-CASP ribonuclease aCPSF1 [Candidatus Jingweiarchaeum tengchongense]MCW1304912.1 beta-CASP ribonuclease aCPSF1 [Candidatus Jingweiarchaeum tengchongense]MCW1306146.1 beta-CASP ribonuclease aCPSF1 [Candidatus Jingweiarchaeum tengchongense]